MRFARIFGTFGLMKSTHPHLQCLKSNVSARFVNCGNSFAANMSKFRTENRQSVAQ